MTSIVERMTSREKSQMISRPVEGQPGLVQVDATWGAIQPMEVAEGVRTVGEIEVIAHLEQGLPTVDGRARNEYRDSTVPGARSSPHTEAEDRIDEFDRERPTVFFCNGPQCGQSPHAIRSLLDAGFPVELIRYYRGGLHDWMTLGLPTVPGRDEEIPPR